MHWGPDDYKHLKKTFVKNIYVKDIQYEPDDLYLKKDGHAGNQFKGDFIIFTNAEKFYENKQDHYERFRNDESFQFDIISKIDNKEVTENFRNFKDIVDKHGINDKNKEREGGKRKSRRNRKSKKGKRSRKARKSRRKSNRRRGRR